MSGIGWPDRAIGAVVVLVLGALAAIGLSQHASTAAAPRTSALGTTATPGSGGGSAPGGDGTPAPATPSSTTTSTSTTTTTTPPPAGPVTAVGDSIMIDIQPDLEALLPGVRVDGLVSRQFETGIGIVQADRAAGTLGQVLVVELGTNGSVTSADVDAMVAAADGVRRIVFVNVCVPRPWAAPDNQVLADGVARHRDVSVLADWNTLATPHPEWFTADQVHLNPAGAAALAGLIAHAA